MCVTYQTHFRITNDLEFLSQLYANLQNLICNGLVLASDGSKMSKRKKNYPDPMEIVGKYGADALRLYLINSPVVRGENLKFR